MNTSTQHVFDALKEATKNSCSGGGVDSSGPFRLLWEPKDTENTYEDLAKFFSRSDLEQEYLSQLNQNQIKYFNVMKNQLQNDIIAPVHRDMTMRYSSRIHRIMDEAGRRKNIMRENSGLLALMQDRVEKFLAVEEAT